jgi:hypothetical protein
MRIGEQDLQRTKDIQPWNAIGSSDESDNQMGDTD